jgi:hypothetical protein
MVWEDPIAADVQRTREMLAAEYGFDVQAIFADLRKRQATLGGRLVSPPKRAEQPAEVNQDRECVSPDSEPVTAVRATER